MKVDIVKQFFQFLEKKEDRTVPLEAALILEMEDKVLQDGVIESFNPVKLSRNGVSTRGLDFLLHQIEDLEKITVRGNVTLSGNYVSGMIADLQAEFKGKELEIFGDYTQIKMSLYPQRITVHGNITLTDFSGFTLPRNLKPEKSLEISSAYNLEVLPENLHIPEDLTLTRLSNLKSIPSGLKIERNLFLFNVGFLEKLTRPSWKVLEKKQIIRDVIESRGGYVKGMIVFP